MPTAIDNKKNAAACYLEASPQSGYIWKII